MVLLRLRQILVSQFQGSLGRGQLLQRQSLLSHPRDRSKGHLLLFKRQLCLFVLQGQGIPLLLKSFHLKGQDRVSCLNRLSGPGCDFLHLHVLRQ